MKPLAIGGVVLIVLGLMALASRGITYTVRETIIDVGPLHATADREKTMPVPQVVGLGAVAGGVALLVAAGVRRQRT
jgi:hypothetical protein